MFNLYTNQAHRRLIMFRALFGEHDWNHYYNKIEAAEKAYRKYPYDNRHNLTLIEHWEKCISEAQYYVNKTITQEGTNNVVIARENFLDKQKQFVRQARSQDHAETPGMGGIPLKIGLST